ncbi:hypothetical protein niasHS_011614 [Heterodera schachtii]|uniref:Uncharacterized protein n=1 Tax=Heterodera schachtii TaxID=97005 RepID=A0ABD2IEW8_HETSC
MRELDEALEALILFQVPPPEERELKQKTFEAVGHILRRDTWEDFKFCISGRQCPYRHCVVITKTKAPLLKIRTTEDVDIDITIDNSEAIRNSDWMAEQMNDSKLWRLYQKRAIRPRLQPGDPSAFNGVDQQLSMRPIDGGQPKRHIVGVQARQRGSGKSQPRGAL